MMAGENDASLQPSAESVLHYWFAVYALGVAVFSLVTTELLPVGLLTTIAADMNVSVGTAGLTVTLPGIVAAVAALLFSVAARRVDRRVLLCILMALLTAANLFSAYATSFAVLLMARVLAGISIGGFFPIVGPLAGRLVPGPAVGRAISIIFGGVAVASVMGVPLGTLLGDATGWRSAFFVMAIGSALTFVALLLSLPRLPTAQSISFVTLRRVLSNARVRTGVLITFLLVTGHFTAYTFVRPILQQLTGVNTVLIGPLLFTYGIAGVLTNFIAGPAAARDVRRVLLCITICLSAVLLLLATLGTAMMPAIALLFIWGLAYGGASVSLQTWMNHAEPVESEAASALFAGMFNLSIAVGALIGRLAVDGIGIRSVLWLGGGLVLGALFAVRAK
jgi:predicted MFS family arabinose efflux permease